METDTPKARGLVIAPFDPEGERVHKAVVGALREIGVEVFRLDGFPAGAPWANAVMNAIRAADFIIVDVTRHNANVLYELGYAHGLKKKTILLISADSGLPPPSDLQGSLFIVYDPGDLQTLKDYVQQFALAKAECGVE